MINRSAKDRYIFHGSIVSSIGIIKYKYFKDGIIEIEKFFKDLRDDSTKKITLSK